MTTLVEYSNHMLLPFGSMLYEHFIVYASFNLSRIYFLIIRYQLAQRRKSSQESKQSERRSSIKNNLQAGVILKVGASAEDGEHREPITVSQQSQQTKKNGSAFVAANKGTKYERK